MTAGRTHGAAQSGLAEDQAPTWTTSEHLESLENPEAYREFVKALYGKLEPRMKHRLSAEAQTELAELARLLMTMPRKAVDEHRAAFETAFALLAAGSPNIIVIRSVRINLSTVDQKNTSLLARLLLHFCGSTPLTAVLAALASILFLSFVLVIGMERGHQWFVGYFDIGTLPVGEIALLIHAAFIGSIVSIMFRISTFIRPAEHSPLLVFISVVTKPFVSVSFSLLVYAVLKAGLVSFLGVNLGGPNAPYLVWAIGFLSGFSERFAQDFVIAASAPFSEKHPLDPGPTTGHPDDRE